MDSSHRFSLVESSSSNNLVVLPGKNCQYVVTRKKLGEGSFSKVYSGYVQRQEPVAIKKIMLDKVEKAKSKSNLEEEIRIMRTLKHNNIVNLLDVVTHEGQIYLIIEHCSDGDLKRYLRKRPMKEKHVLYYQKQLMEGLQYLKSRNIMHRDLKPQNLLLTDNKRILKISDFGFAKTLNSDESMNETMCGTPYYMAPEIMHNQTYNAKADLWSVGIIMYEMLYALYPFGEHLTGPYELRDKIDSTEITYPELSEDPLSEKVLNLLNHLLQKLPANRITWDDYFNHAWFNPHKRPQTTVSSSVIISHQSQPQQRTIAMSAPVKTSSFVMPRSTFNRQSSMGAGMLFEMEDDTGLGTSPSSNNNLTLLSYKDNTPPSVSNGLSSSPFLDSQMQSVTPVDRPFLQLVDNYRSESDVSTTSVSTTSVSVSSSNRRVNSSTPVIIRHPQYEDDEEDATKSAMSTLGAYWNASLRLAKDSLTRSFHSLP
jgi:serine/threonine protein kinase